MPSTKFSGTSQYFQRPDSDPPPPVGGWRTESGPSQAPLENLHKASVKNLVTSASPRYISRVSCKFSNGASARSLYLINARSASLRKLLSEPAQFLLPSEGGFCRNARPRSLHGSPRVYRGAKTPRTASVKIALGFLHVFEKAAELKRTRLTIARTGGTSCSCRFAPSSRRTYGRPYRQKPF